MDEQNNNTQRAFLEYARAKRRQEIAAVYEQGTTLATYQNQQNRNEENAREQEKIGLLFVTILLLLALTADIVDIITAGTIGWLIGIIVDVIMFIMVIGRIYTTQKTLRFWNDRTFQLIFYGNAIEFIPVIGSLLPARTAAVIVAFVTSRNKKLATLVNVAQTLQGRSKTLAAKKS